jgi:hypothetical protein
MKDIRRNLTPNHGFTSDIPPPKVINSEDGNCNVYRNTGKP